MAGKVQGLTVEINGDATKLSKALRDVKSEATVLRTHLSALGKLLEFNPTSIDLITQKQGMLGQALDQNKRAYEMMQRAEEEYHSQIGPHSEAEIAEYRNLQREMTNNRLQYEQLRQQAIEFGAGASASTLAAKAAYAELGAALESAGKKLTVLSAGAAYVGYECANAAIQFENSFTGVTKTVNATEAEFEKLANAARDMALVKPIDVNDINYAMELGGQLGIATDNLMLFASTCADLDIATDLDIEGVSMKLAQFVNITGTAQTDVDRLGAVITDLGNNSATTESKIMNMAMRIAGSGSNIGMTAQEVLALAASLSSVGIEAEMGGNAISTIMNRIDKDVANSSDTLQVWADTAGMSADEFVQKWGTDVMGALLDVINGMGTYRDEGNNLNLLLKDMGVEYMRQVDTMQRLSRTGDLVTDMVEIANNAWDENIALTREANRRYETTESQLQLVKNNLNELAIEIGQMMLPAIRDISGSAVELLQAFQGLDDETKRNVISFGMFAAAAGPAVLLLGKLSTATSKVIGVYASAKTAVNLLTRGTIDSTGAIDAQVAAAERSALKTGVMAKAASLAKGAVAGLAVAGVLVLVDAIAKAIDHHDKLENATDGLRGAMDSMDSSIRDAADSVASMSTETARRSFQELTDSINETIDAQSKLADEIAEEWGDINASSYAIEQYTSVIEELTGKYDENGTKVALTAEEQAKLKAAVAGLNEVCGTSYEVVDAVNGVLSDSTENIKQNTDAWILNAKAQAAQEQMVELMKNELTLKQNMVDAQRAYNAAKEKYDESLLDPTNIDAQARYGEEMKEASAKLEEATDLYYDNKAAIEATADAYSEATEELSNLGPAIDNIKSHISNFGDEVAEAFDAAGVSQDDFAKKVADAGVSVEDFKTLSADQLKQLVESYDGTYESIGGLMDQFISDNLFGGTAAGLAFRDGLDESKESVIEEAASIYGLTVEQFAGLAGQLGYDGADGVAAFARGILSGEPDTKSNAAVIAAVARGIANGNSWQWGYDLCSNFANGISGGMNKVAVAATNVALTVKNKLGHSVPKEGPLHNNGKGETEWGEHAIQNFIDGMAGKETDLAAQASSISSILADELSGAGLSSGLRNVAGWAGVPDLGSKNASSATGSVTESKVVNNYTIGNVTLSEGSVEAGAVRTLVDYARRTRLAYGS